MSTSHRSYKNSFRFKLSNKKLLRQFPILAAFHRLVDGALIGFVFTVVAMSAISLHAQHLWALSFSRLETSRQLIYKLKESISILESHFLESKNLPTFLVETKTSDLIYLDKPDLERHLTKNVSTLKDHVNTLLFSPANHGY